MVLNFGYCLQSPVYIIPGQTRVNLSSFLLLLRSAERRGREMNHFSMAFFSVFNCIVHFWLRCCLFFFSFPRSIYFTHTHHHQTNHAMQCKRASSDPWIDRSFVIDFSYPWKFLSVFRSFLLSFLPSCHALQKKPSSSDQSQSNALFLLSMLFSVPVSKATPNAYLQ